MTPQESHDVTELTQLILRERQGRDRGWWTQMAASFTPQAQVRVSWFEGSAQDFVTQSRSMSESGTNAAHRMAPPLVRLHGDRAIVEAPAVIELRTSLAGVEVDLESKVRLLFRATRHPAGWLIDALDCIYENDTVTPVIPGTTPDIDRDRLAGMRESYRWLTYSLSAVGHTINEMLPGEDRPDDVERLYAHTISWLEGGDAK